MISNYDEVKEGLTNSKFAALLEQVHMLKPNELESMVNQFIVFLGDINRA